jgi:hypothetical protein
MLLASLDCPAATLDVSPATPPYGDLPAVIGLQLLGIHHPKAPVRLRREGTDQVSRLRHPVHETTLRVFLWQSAFPR